MARRCKLSVGTFTLLWHNTLFDGEWQRIDSTQVFNNLAQMAYLGLMVAVQQAVHKQLGKSNQKRYVELWAPYLDGRPHQVCSKIPGKEAKTYPIRLTFQEFFQQPHREAGEAFLKRCYFWATHISLEPIIQATKTIRKHREGDLNRFDSQIIIGSSKDSRVLSRPPKPDLVDIEPTTI